MSPVAVIGNALILRAIWKNTFQRTPFHILLSGLAATDLCTRLIAQPFTVATTWLYSVNSELNVDRPVLSVTIDTIGNATTTYFIFITLSIITLMSVERWLHMSRRSMVTSRRGYFIAIVFLLLPVPVVVFRSLKIIKPGTIGNELNITALVYILFCFLTTSVAYFNVFRIINSHQLQVQANARSPQNFGQPAINLAKYKKSVNTILCILALFSFCFLPFTIFVGIHVLVGHNRGTELGLSISIVLLFLSSSLNPGLYLWRMNDVRDGVKQLFC